jgi:hypothetical protein
VEIYWDGGDGINQSFIHNVDQNFNLSSHVGIPVNGIIGSVFTIIYSKLTWKKKGFYIRTTGETEKDRKRKYKKKFPLL